MKSMSFTVFSYNATVLLIQPNPTDPWMDQTHVHLWTHVSRVTTARHKTPTRNDNYNKKLSYRRGTARRAVTVKTVLNVAQMFVELHNLISPALGEWPSRSSKVTGNGTLLPFNGCFSGQTRVSRFQFATTCPTISTENLRVVLDERSRLIRGQPSTRPSVSNNHTALWPEHVARPRTLSTTAAGSVLCSRQLARSAGPEERCN